MYPASYTEKRNFYSIKLFFTLMAHFVPGSVTTTYVGFFPDFYWLQSKYNRVFLYQFPDKDKNDRKTPTTPPPIPGLTGPVPGIPPGMLSAALMGTPPSGTPPGSTHPPTPPRTPKVLGAGDVKPPMAHQQAGQPSPSSAPPPPMPPLLSLAAIQEQVKGPNILAAQLSKPMMLPGNRKFTLSCKIV